MDSEYYQAIRELGFRSFNITLGPTYAERFTALCQKHTITTKGMFCRLIDTQIAADEAAVGKEGGAA